MDRGVCQATIHGVTKSWTRLSDWVHTHTHRHLCHSHILAIVNSAAVNISMHVSFKLVFSLSSGNIHGWTTGSSFWGLSILYSGCTDLHSHQQCTSVPLLHTFFLLGEKLCNCDYPPICGIPTQRSRSSSYYFSTALPPTFHIWLWLFLYIFSCGKMFAASLQVVLVDRCSVNCCDFGVPVRVEEFRVFLLHCLGHLSNLFS